MGLGFPPARTRDAAAAAAGYPEAVRTSGGNAPQARLFSFAIREATGVACCVSAPFNGPAVVQELVFRVGTDGANPFPVVQLYAADDSGGGGVNLAATFVPSGDPIFDPMVITRDDGVTASGVNGFEVSTLNESIGWQFFPVRRAVNKGRFFLKILVRSDKVAAMFMDGYVRVLEGVPPDQLANFL